MGKGRAERERARKLKAQQEAQAAQAVEDVKQALQDVDRMLTVSVAFGHIAENKSLNLFWS